MRQLRVLTLVHTDLVPPTSIEGISDKDMADWKTEYDVVAGLQNLGHEVLPLGVSDDLGVIREAINEFRPHITFNLLEEFHGVATYDHYVISYLELIRKAYTGCNPRGLMIAHDKALTKKILSYHRIPVPAFAVVPVGKKFRRPKRLEFPLLVKSATEEASLGISQASIVHSDDKLRERVAFIHEHTASDALVEEYIDGREMYVGMLGNQRLQTFPIWEMLFTKSPAHVARIATAKVKWDDAYQQRHGIVTQAAKDLPAKLEQTIIRLCKRIYHHLSLTGYARMDLRVTDEGRIYVLEANPNPNLAYGEDFAESAETAGIDFENLLQRILNLGLRYAAEWKR